MPSIRTSRIYNKSSDLELSKFAGKTSVGLTNNPKLSDPPVAPTAVQAMKQAFDQAMIAAYKGGTLATAMKDAARATLAAALDKNASYVDIQCDDDLTVLLSSGYEPVNTNRTQSVLNAPVIVGTEYGQTGEVKLRVQGDPNRRAIQGRCKVQGGEWGPVITFQSSRKILFDSLVAGSTYLFQLIGLGGSTGQSDWSEPVTKIAV